MATRSRSNRIKPATGALPAPSPSAASGPPPAVEDVEDRRPGRNRGAARPAAHTKRKRAAARPATGPARARQGAGAQRKAPKKNTAGMVSALEDTAGKPSRKSTRKSTNRARSAETRYPTTVMKARTPKARNTRTATRQARARGKGR